ncbi:MAG: diguanylate cyclase [Armatimonadota bacterium]|nr:diguanylate cyclase [Armatimonadota bacterium]
MTLLRSVLWLPLLVWLWLRDYSQNVAVATMAIPGVFLGAWALRFYNLSAQRQCILHKPCSHLDPVTGTLNHGSIHQILQQQSLQALRYQYPLSLVYLDIDRFSLFNATYGHDVGDQLLRRMAHTLRSLLPPGAFLGRYDADEFLVLLPHTRRAQALIIARQLAERIHQSVLLQASNGQVVPVTVSIGVACLPEDAPSMPALLSAAQSALLLAQQHRNSVADIHSDWRARYRIHLDGAFSTLEALITAIDHKDHYTRRHSEQVAEFAQWIAEELDLPEEQQHALRLAGLVHDVGKIGIPDEVLQKPDLLTAEEYETMKQHPVLGAVMLAALPGMEHLAPLVRSHHERWDGRGYPDGLAGEQIPFLARVLTVADAFSAMTTDRPYRRGMSWQSALLELQHQRGKQFDPMLVDAFVAAVHKRRLLEQHDSRELAAA